MIQPSLPSFFEGSEEDELNQLNRVKENGHRSGSFVDNMKLPIHRWYRFSAGFSAEWVESVLADFHDVKNIKILDPFAGSGTTLLASDKKSMVSIGYEAQPLIAKIAQYKLCWDSNASDFQRVAYSILEDAQNHPIKNSKEYPKLISQCFSDNSIQKLDSLKESWIKFDDQSDSSNLCWLAITSILRSSSHAGTAQWQYILPNKEKRKTSDPYEAYKEQITMMIGDMHKFQENIKKSNAQLIHGDSRCMTEISDNDIDVVITSPPYANNYDYADSTRLELTFWGFINSWGDLQKNGIRDNIIVSSSQHASQNKISLEEILSRESLNPIRSQITSVCHELDEIRFQHGGRKHYHTMVASYFSDLSLVFKELRRVCKPNSKVCFVIGDSAPYGVYVPVDKWLGEIALSYGFNSFSFEKLRDRNIKWKNRKHRVPLNEGRLWIEG